MFNTHLPIKFKCIHCDKIYLSKYQTDHLHDYPPCPACNQNGLLLGIAKKSDLVRHPITFMHIAWHKPNKTHS